MLTLQRADATIAYQARGHGPPTLWIQGAGVPAVGWNRQIDALEGEFACASFDNRGIGQSSAGPVSVDAMVGDALAVLDALGWERAHVLGHSIGGVLAHQLALDHRDRVLSLTLTSTFSRGKEAVSLSAFMAWVGLRCRVGTRAMRRRAFLEILLSPTQRAAADLDEAAVEYGAFFGRDLADQPAVIAQQLLAMSRHDASERLGELAGVPTLVLTGAEDRLARPEFNRRLAERIPGSRYVEIPGAAHGLPLSMPERTNAAIREHLLAAQR